MAKRIRSSHFNSTWYTGSVNYTLRPHSVLNSTQSKLVISSAYFFLETLYSVPSSQNLSYWETTSNIILGSSFWKVKNPTGTSPDKSTTIFSSQHSYSAYCHINCKNAKPVFCLISLLSYLAVLGTRQRTKLNNYYKNKNTRQHT